MKRKYFVLMPLLLAVLAMTTGACSSDSTYSSTDDLHDCVVTSVTMGSLNRYLKTTAKDGSDSTYRVTVTGGLYPIYIDQVNSRIYNTDSLPLGTDVSRVVFSSINSTGVMGIRSLHTEADTAFSATDSTDFSVPRQVTVYAYDGVGKKTYTMSINVHQQEADSFVWNKVLTADAQLQALEGAHRLLHRADGALLVYGTVNGQPVVLSATTPGAWQTTVLPAGFDPLSVVTSPTATLYYARTSDGLYTSADGVAWTASSSDFVPDALLAAGSNTVTALRGGAFYSSADGGLTWTADGADEPQYIPVKDCGGTVMTALTDPLLENFVALGRMADGKAVVWRRTVDLSGMNTFDWYYLPDITGYAATTPEVETPSVFSYDNKTVLVGRRPQGGLTALYISSDNGRTWSTEILDNPADGTTTDGYISATADGDNYVWVLESTTGSLWRGRYNRLGWQDDQTSFERSNKK